MRKKPTRKDRNLAIRLFETELAKGEKTKTQIYEDVGARTRGVTGRTVKRWVHNKPTLIQALKAEQESSEETPHKQKMRKPAHKASGLMKHLDELAKTAERLAYHSQRLLRYKDDADVESTGNVFDHIFFWRVSNRTVVAESPDDPTRESIYEKRHPIDPYLAKLLSVHYQDVFGSLPFTEWSQLSNLTVTDEVVENLKFLAHGGLKACPNCPICFQM